MVDRNDTLLREVDEELRRERMEKFWNRYGTYVLAAAGLFVFLVGGFKYLEARDKAAAEAAGTQFESAVALAKSGKADDANAAFSALASSDNAGYAALAELKMAGALVKAGKPQDALTAFDKLAKKPGVDPLITGFAQLQGAALRAGEADFTELKNRLTPLMADGSAWKVAATEMLGMAAIKAGKLIEARIALAPLLADPRLSRTASERIRTAMSAIAAMESSKPSAAAPESAGAKDAAPAVPGGKPADDKK